MDLTVHPGKLSGVLSLPGSKSVGHRMIIAAGLGGIRSALSGITLSADISATLDAMNRLGAKSQFLPDGRLEITAIVKPKAATLDCRESGSTLRFLIPIAAVLGQEVTFVGSGNLPNRPLTPYLRELPLHNVNFSADKLPFSISGRLTAGKYYVEGDISSQFITGLLYALPLCVGDSIISIKGTPESQSYINMTIDVLRRFGIKIHIQSTGNDTVYRIKGGQHFGGGEHSVPIDISQAAFFLVANALGSDVKFRGLEKLTEIGSDYCCQGDVKILEFLDGMGYNSMGVSSESVFKADVHDCPDLVPILAVAGCFGEKTLKIQNAKRLRIKECDRLTATSNFINALGGRVKEESDTLTIYPSQLRSGRVDSFNDHRIVMATAIAATCASGPVTICGAEAVEKSYPKFFDDFAALGGKIS